MGNENQSLTLIESVDATLPSVEKLDQMKAYATTLVKSGMCAKGLDTPEKVLGAMLKGRELGLPAMKSVSGGIFVFNGRAGLEGQLMLDLIYARCPGVEIEFVETSPVQSVIRVKKNKDAQPQTFTFTMAQAEAAKYNQSYDRDSKQWTRKATWNDPATMLTWRNVSRIGKLVFPHILGGAYIPDEIEDISSNEASEVHAQVESPAPFKPKSKKAQDAPVVDAEVIDTPTPQPSPPPAPKPAAPAPAAPAAAEAPAQKAEPAKQDPEPWGAKDAMHELDACKTIAEVGAVMRRVGAARFPDDIAQGLAQASTLKLAAIRGTTPVMDEPEEKQAAPAMPALPLTTLPDFDAALKAGMDPAKAWASYKDNAKDGAAKKAVGFSHYNKEVADRRAKGLA